LYGVFVLPVVWIFGASGVGKSTAGFRVLQGLAAAGVVAALVDADQLRLARGVSASETQLIASGLPRLEREFGAHDARVLIVTGIADDAAHLSSLLAGLPRHRVFTVHLDVEAPALRERIRRRGSLLDEMEENVEYAARLDPSLAGLRIDTTGRAVAEIASRITAEVMSFLEAAASDSSDVPRTNEGAGSVGLPREAVLISGPGGVGLSTIGYSTYSRMAATGRPAAYLDAYQLGFLGAEPRSEELAPMRAANVTAIADILTRAGAHTIVVTGDARTIRSVSDAWRGAPLTAIWLHASPEALAERITQRARGAGPGIPGDHRAGLDGPALAEAIATAVGERTRYDDMPDGTAVVDTSALTAAQAAEGIVARLGNAAD